MGVSVQDQFPNLPTPDAPTVMAHSASLGAWVGVIAGYLPTFAVLIPMIYYALLIWESKTVQTWRKRRRLLKIARKIKRRRQKS